MAPTVNLPVLLSAVLSSESALVDILTSAAVEILELPLKLMSPNPEPIEPPVKEPTDVNDDANTVLPNIDSVNTVFESIL